MNIVDIQKVKRENKGFWDIGVVTMLKYGFWVVFGIAIMIGYYNGKQIYQEGLMIKVPTVQEAKAN